MEALLTFHVENKHAVTHFKRRTCNEISTLTVNYVRIFSHIMYVTNQIQKAFTEWNKHKITNSSV